MPQLMVFTDDMDSTERLSILQRWVDSLSIRTRGLARLEVLRGKRTAWARVLAEAGEVRPGFGIAKGSSPQLDLDQLSFLFRLPRRCFEGIRKIRF